MNRERENAQSVRTDGTDRTRNLYTGQHQQQQQQYPIFTTGNGINQKTIFEKTAESESRIGKANIMIDNDKMVFCESSGNNMNTITEKQEEQERHHNLKRSSSANNSANNSSSSLAHGKGSTGRSRKEVVTEQQQLKNNAKSTAVGNSSSLTETSLDSIETTTSSSTLNEKKEIFSAKVRDVLTYCEEMQLNSREKRQIVTSFGVKKRHSRKMVKNDANRQQRTLGPYIKFCAEWREILKNQNPHWTATELVKNLGANWQRLKIEDRTLLETRFGLKPESSNNSSSS